MSNFLSIYIVQRIGKLLISIITFFLNQNFNSILIFQIIVIFTYIVADLVSDQKFIDANLKRKTNAIENAFSVDITGLETKDYYNNSIPFTKPVDKYIVNIFESVFFTNEILSKMKKKYILRLFVFTCLIIISFEKVTDEFLLINVFQFIFIGRTLPSCLRYFLYKSDVNELYDKFYENLITNGISQFSQKITLLNYCIHYEAIKINYKININSKIYNKYNPQLSNTWKEICKKIIINSK